jgi:hypothetical protein
MKRTSVAWQYAWTVGATFWQQFCRRPRDEISHSQFAAAAAAVGRTVQWPNETSRRGSMALEPSVMLNDPGRTLIC